MSTWTGEEMRVVATPLLLVMFTENRLMAAATPAPSRENSNAAKMMALASSATQAGSAREDGTRASWRRKCPRLLRT